MEDIKRVSKIVITEKTVSKVNQNSTCWLMVQFNQTTAKNFPLSNFFEPQMTYCVNPCKFLKLNKVWLTRTLEPLLTNNKHKSQIMKLGQVLTKARLSGLTSLAYFDFRYNVQRSFQNSPYDPEILLNWHLQTLGHFFDFPNFLFFSLDLPVTKKLILNTK